VSYITQSSIYHASLIVSSGGFEMFRTCPAWQAALGGKSPVNRRGRAACGRAKLLEESAYGALANPWEGFAGSPPAVSFQK